MTDSTGAPHAGVGVLSRVRLAAATLFGDASACRARTALGQLDTHRRWHRFTFSAQSEGGAGEQGGLPPDLAALERFGGAERRGDAADVRHHLSRSARDSLDRLHRGYQAAAAGHGEEALAEARALDGLRNTVGQHMARFRALVEAHCAAQRAAWDHLATSGPAARAARLAEVLVSLPDIPQLPKPDVRSFTTPYERAVDLVPQSWRENEVEGVCFDATEVAQLAPDAVAAAPAAEAALTRYLYDAARGYEAALGRDRAAQVLAVLRDPAAVRDLRARRPDLFEEDYRTASATGMVGLLPLMLVTALLAEHAPEWREHPERAAGTPAAPDAPGGGAAVAAGAWLAALDVPSAGELHDTVLLIAASEAEDDEANDIDDDDMGDDAGGDSADSDSE